MADLRGEQLKDSYQNVVTRGTGNKLENGNGVEFADLDDKASLSGGADADFSAMPWVDGSPIIERDSNSDGEWIRFSNGIQIVFREILVEVNWGPSNVGDWYEVGNLSFPQVFEDGPLVFGGGGFDRTGISATHYGVGLVAIASRAGPWETTRWAGVDVQLVRIIGGDNMQFLRAYVGAIGRYEQ